VFSLFALRASERNFITLSHRPRDNASIDLTEETRGCVHNLTATTEGVFRNLSTIRNTFVDTNTGCVHRTHNAKHVLHSIRISGYVYEPYYDSRGCVHIPHFS
jgi:hypothetical protein